VINPTLLDLSPEPAGGSLILLAFVVMGLVAAGILGFVFFLKRRKRRSSDHRGGASHPSNPNQP
jgi:flagellar basal body-associated protein FliL